MKQHSQGMPRKASYPKLLLPGILFLLFYALSLSMASSVRRHLPVPAPDWQFLIPFFVWLGASLTVQRYTRYHLSNADPWILPNVTTLCGWGLLTIWRLSPSLGAKQMLWYLLGCAIVLFGLKQPNLIGTMYRYRSFWLFLGLILIGLTFLIGVNPAGAGTKLWLRFFNFYLQPSEPLKLLMIIYLAAFFADQIRPNLTLFQSILPSLIVIGIAGLLLLAQRDLGAASLFVVLYALMLTVTTQSRIFLWLLPLLAIVSGSAAYFLSDLVRSRIDIWMNPWLETSGASYQLVQARIAIAAGGISGTGPGLGSPGFVPVAVSDFIFTTLAEEGGLLFTTAFLLLTLFLALRGITIAQTGKTAFGRYLAFGISAYLVLQSLFIVGGNLGLVPLTGVTLPFMSYGGSSLVTNLFAMLLLLRLSAERSAYKLPQKSYHVYRRISVGFIALFILVLITNSHISVIKQEQLLAMPENIRWAIYDRYVPRGNILAQNGEILAHTTGSTGAFRRRLTYPPFSSVIGYATASYGQTGLEKSLYPVLRGYAGKPYVELWWHQRFFNQPPPGQDIRLNINIKLQQYADTLLKGKNGAILLLNAGSGEIIASSTYPSFNANQLEQDWSNLISRSDAPLLNRATQGLYPLGNLHALLALTASFEENPSAKPLEGINTRLDADCRIAMQPVRHTAVKALQHGCQMASFELSEREETAEILQTARNLGLFTQPSIAIETAPVAAEPDPELEQTQFIHALSELKVSPLQLALWAAAISNDGAMPQPQLVNAYASNNGSWQPFTASNLPLTQVMSSATALSIQKRLTQKQVGSASYYLELVGKQN